MLIPYALLRSYLSDPPSTKMDRGISYPAYPLLFATISGAHLYGFPSVDSDYDLRGVHILPIPELVSLQKGPETIERTHEYQGLLLDLVTHEAGKFFRLLLRRNGYVLEQLFSPLVVFGSVWHDELKEVARLCITRFHCYHYLGFSHSQWRLLEKKQQVKPLLYVYRVLLTGIHLMQTGEVEANLVHLQQKFQLPLVDDLLLRKQMGVEHQALAGDEMAFHQEQYERLREKLEQESQRSTLPEMPSAQKALHDLLLRIRFSANHP